MANPAEMERGSGIVAVGRPGDLASVLGRVLLSRSHYARGVPDRAGRMAEQPSDPPRLGLERFAPLVEASAAHVAQSARRRPGGPH